jgi:PKD repeat protein
MFFMKKLLLVVLFIGISAWTLNAQISQGGIPPSFKYNISANIDRITLHPRDMKYVMNEEKKLSKDGHLSHIGYSLNTDISIDNSGTWTDLPDGGRIWQVQIKSPSALAQVVYYDKFHLPVGSKLFLYNEDKTQIIGAFTWYNNDPSGYFANELIYGDVVNLEYYEPAGTKEKPIIHIDNIGYIYRGVSIRKNTNWTEPSEACEINVICTPVGDNWQDEKQGVARILVTTPSGQGWCSGSLVNNTNQDCTPYFLTAWHCYEDATTAQLNQWIFYFNYESSTCTTPTTEPSSNSMTGASLKAAASINGGSDFILLQLNQSVPTTFNPYMNGWDRNNSVTGPGVGIHHPASSIKKISTYNSATTGTYSGAATNAHWQVVWVTNSNGWGVTEGGSSGSPIFDANKHIVGTLTGGGSDCAAQSSPDYYGKVYYHWDQNAGGTTTQLKTWLDPAGTNPTSLNGKFCNGSTPSDTVHVNFSGTPLSVPVGGSVNFTDLSTGNPTNWQWTFSGGTPATSSVQNPTNIVYNTVGTYNVKLKAWNATTSDSLTKSLYINVYDPNAIVADFSGTPTTVLVGGTVQFTDLSTNTPTTWSWSFTGGTPATSIVQNPTVQYNTAGVFPVTLIASNSTSRDTMTKSSYITVIDTSQVPHADFTADYTSIPAGTSINFTNLSTGYYDSLAWIFTGAVPGTSTNQNPTLINYPTIGNYDVTLILYSVLGNDTLTKPGYIHVFDGTLVDTVHANFQAITSRLIVQGGTVSFEDLSTGGPVTSWNWYFEGGTPTNSIVQNPANITYSTPGIYTVRLAVSSGPYSDTLVKTDYIVVTTTPWPNPDGFCDTISNIMPNEHPLVFIHLEPNHWGYVPGQNQLKIMYYADKFTNYTFTNVSELIIPVVKAYGATASNKVRFTVWKVDSITGLPSTVLGYKDELINSFSPQLYKSIQFTNPIPVNGKFFVGYQLYYNTPADTFVVYMAPDRGQNGLNTMYMKKSSGSWMTLSQFFNDTLHYNTSLAIRVIGCLVGVPEIDIQQHTVIYPNPANNQLTVEFVDIQVNKAEFEVYDLLGKKLQVTAKSTFGNNQFTIDIHSLSQGMYILRAKVNGVYLNQRFTKL